MNKNTESADQSLAQAYDQTPYAGQPFCLTHPSLLATPRRCGLEIGDRPIASPVARLLAPSGRVTNLRHRSVVMDDDMAGFVLGYLDGDRSRDELIDLTLEGIQTGRIHLPNQEAGSKGISHEWVGKAVDSILQHLSRCGIMVG